MMVSSLSLIALTLALLGLFGWFVASLWLPQASAGDRVRGAVVVGSTFAMASAWLLAELAVFSRFSVLLVFGTGAAMSGFAYARARPPGPRWPLLRAVESLLPLLVAGLALGVALVAAWVLPIWQWDSLGYHLPFVNFVLQNGSRADVPHLIPYISTYPHGIEYLFLIFRAMMPDDRLIDLGQIPLGVVGALFASGVATRIGAKREQALVAGALWLTLPAVFLQLPTNYVDVGAAAYLLMTTHWLLTPPGAPHHRRALMLAAVSLGLYLGSKPSAPLPTLIMASALGWALWRAKGPRDVLAGASIVTLLGTESYLRNWLATGNPVWPIAVRLGPLHLPGERTVEKLVSAGAAAPRPHGGFFERLLESWTTMAGPPAFDMRLGGFGPVILLFALPLTVAFVARAARAEDRRQVWLWLVAVVASVAHPEPSTARFVLAFPALLLAAAVAAVAAWRRRALVGGAFVAASVFAGWSLWHAFPGLTMGGDLTLGQMASLPHEARRRALGPDGSPQRWLALTAQLGPDHAVAYDESFTLPGLLWNEKLTNRVVALPWGTNGRALEATLRRSGATHLVAGEDLPAGELARENGARFVKLFDCGSDPCHVYRILPPTDR